MIDFMLIYLIIGCIFSVVNHIMLYVTKKDFVYYEYNPTVLYLITTLFYPIIIIIVIKKIFFKK